MKIKKSPKHKVIIGKLKDLTSLEKMELRRLMEQNERIINPRSFPVIELH